MIIRLVFSLLFAVNLLSLSSGRISRAFIGVITSGFTATMLVGAACLLFSFPARLATGGNVPPRVWLSFKLYAGLMLILGLHNSISLALGGFPSPGLIGQELMGMPQIFAFYFVGVAAWQKFGEDGVIKLMESLVVGFIIWGAVNIALMKTGYGNVSSESAVAMFGGIEGRRASAPLAPAGNHFGVLLAINGVCATAIYLLSPRKMLMDGFFRLGVAIVAVALSLYGSFLIENRSSLLVWFFGIMLIPFAWHRYFRFVPPLVVAGWICAPFLIFYVFSSLKFLDLIPRSWDVLFMRGDSDLSTFGLRTPIYAYGFSLIKEGYVPLWGAGMLNTDASSVLMEYYPAKEITLVGFHCVFLQYYIQFGPLLAFAAFGVFAWIPLCLTRLFYVGRGFALPLVILSAYYFSHTLDVELKQFELYGPFVLAILLFARNLPPLVGAAPGSR